MEYGYEESLNGPEKSPDFFFSMNKIYSNLCALYVFFNIVVVKHWLSFALIF